VFRSSTNSERCIRNGWVAIFTIGSIVACSNESAQKSDREATTGGTENGSAQGGASSKETVKSEGTGATGDSRGGSSYRLSLSQGGAVLGPQFGGAAQVSSTGATSSTVGGSVNSGGGTRNLGGNTSGGVVGIGGKSTPAEGGKATGGSRSGTTTGAGGTSVSTTSATDIIANFQNGGYLNDTSGKRIEAHGGGFLLENGTWYWFGEDKSQNSGNFRAVNCYSSTDLSHWEFRRAIITKSTAPELNTTDRIVERPKVIYNATTKKYVMWLHWEGKDYADAKAGVFTSSTIDGNYTYVSAFRPNNNMSRDDTLFKDDDGKAYFISAANENKDLAVYELSEDYLTVKRQILTLWAGSSREAPAIFKQSGRYFLITSGCTGWEPNQAKYATATSMAGPWSSLTNLADGTTYDSQSTFVIPIQGSKATTYVYVGDRWQDPDLVSSKYIFLPLKISGTSLTLDYYERWQLNLTTGNWSTDDGFLPQGDWKVLYVDSEEKNAENGSATRAFDGSGMTFWHTEYDAKKPPYPHELQIDLGATYDLDGMRYLPRQDKDANGMVAKYEFYVSEDSKNYGAAVATGTFASTRSETIVKFAKKTGRYIRFVALSPLTESSYASVGELDVLGTKH
jgi:hypothetical protein